MESKYNSLSLGSLVQEGYPPRPVPFFVLIKDRKGKKKKKKNLIAEHLSVGLN